MIIIFIKVDIICIDALHARIIFICALYWRCLRNFSIDYIGITYNIMCLYRFAQLDDVDIVITHQIVRVLHRRPLL